MDKTIFRAYDIRGIYPSQINEDFVYKFGQAFGTRIKEEGQTFTVIGYDNRESSKPLFESLSKGINASGVDVICLGFCTTPMYYFSWHHLKAKSGIMITASHNPKEYNGLKFSFNGIYNAHGQEVVAFYDYIVEGNFAIGSGKTTFYDIKQDYLNCIFKNIHFGKRKLKAVFDVGNASGSVVIKDVLEQLNIDYIPLYFESDPNFPNHHPDPSVPKNLVDLINTVKQEKADVGFALDGDADRIGMVDENGQIIEADKIMIIAIRDILNNLKDKRILYDVKCSKTLEDEIIKLKGKPILSRTGNSYLRATIAKENILFGGEFSGHIFFNDKFLGYDDGIYVALRMLEILSKTNKKCSELLDGINHYYSTEELKIPADDNIKFKVINDLIHQAKGDNEDVIDIDGCKVIYDDGFALIRVSNTGPIITARFEGKTKKRRDELQDYWLEKTKALIKKYSN